MEQIRRFFRRLGKGLKAKGYTLVEVAAVVAVTGTLAAIAMPVVLDKIAAGKVTAAQGDVNAMKDAILFFMKDTGLPPFYKIAANTLPVISVTTNYNSVLVTADGVNPVNGTDWSFPVLSSTPTASLDAQLNDNVPQYPTKSINAWRGPYLPSVSKEKIRKDPWGNKYLVSIKGLTEDDTSGTKYQRAVFVLSAGPNGIVETFFEQKIRVIEGLTGSAQETLAFVLGGDDIISRIQ